MMCSEAQDPTRASRSAGKQILIVEDEPVLRRFVARFLEGRGLQVVQAGTLREASARLERAQFDAVILDIGLPDGDGLSLVSEAVADRCVVITAQPDTRRFEECGVTHYFAKPVDLRVLANTVEQLAFG